MTATEIIIALIIHLILPLVGFLYFLRIKKQMELENITKAPIIELFAIFATYGGLLLVILTTFFWQWSGMASLGIFYLIFGAPFVMGYIVYRHTKTKNLSKYHKYTYKAGQLYFVIAPLTIGLLFLIVSYLENNHRK